MNRNGRLFHSAAALLEFPYAANISPLKCADFFSGIGGFHIAARNLGLNVVFACDIDPETRRAYQANFGMEPQGDI